MVRDSNGYFHAFWHSQTNPNSAPIGSRCDIYYSHTTIPAQEPPSMAFQAKWTVPVNLTYKLYNQDNRYPSVAIEYEYYTGAWHSYNKIHVVWQAKLPNGLRYEVLYASLPISNPPGPGAPWGSAQNLSNTSYTDSLVPAIAINKYNPGVTSQHLHVVWQEEDIFSGGLPFPQEDGWYSDIAYIRSTNSGAGWSGPAGGWGGYVWDNLTKSAYNSQMPSIGCILDQYTKTPGGNPGDLGYNSDDVHVTFNQDTGGANIRVWYLRSQNDGLNWNVPVDVTAKTGGVGYDAYSNIAVDMLDHPHIVFMRNNITKREPLQTVAGNNYLPGINPSQWWAFPGPQIGMGNVLQNSVIYAYFDGLNWASKTWTKTADLEFPTVALDRWQHVNVNWQEYTPSTGDYEITRICNLNTNAPAFPLVVPVYGGWLSYINDSNDPGKDDFFPNLAHKKAPMYMSPSGPNVAGYDEIWTKTSGHGPGAAIAPVARGIIQDGNMKYDAGL